MPVSESPTLLVVPAFRESRRLPRFLPDLCRAVEEMDSRLVQVRVVDDGSGETEQRILTELVTELRQSYPFLQEPLVLEKNRGKGGAVYAGWDASESADFGKLGFVDADGAVSAAEVVRVLELVPGSAADECLYAARLDDSDQAIKRTLVRKWLGLLFRRITRMFFKLPIRDSQCGFKIVPARPYHEIRSQLTELRYCFDIDLTIHLLKAGLKIREIPISWTETPGTKITLSQGTKMLGSLWQLRKKVG
ncbi:MAG: glycosyltransferase [Verrucomicrobiales bacterium]